MTKKQKADLAARIEEEMKPKKTYAYHVKIKSTITFNCGQCEFEQTQHLEVTTDKEYGYYAEINVYLCAEAVCQNCQALVEIHEMQP
jgi:hypothetical protein